MGSTPLHQIDDLRRPLLRRLCRHVAFELLVDRLAQHGLVMVDEFAGIERSGPAVSPCAMLPQSAPVKAQPLRCDPRLQRRLDFPSRLLHQPLDLSLRTGSCCNYAAGAKSAVQFSR